MADCPGAGRRHPAMVGVGDKIYVGLGDGNGESGNWQNFNDFYEYDVASNEWSRIDDLPAIERHHPFYFDLDGTVYVGMGHSSNGIMADWFKLVNGSWVELENFVSYKDGQRITSE